MAGKSQESHGTISEFNSVFGLEKVDRWNPIRTSAIQSRSRPMRFLGFPNHEEGAPRQEISKQSTVCSTFSRSGWSVVRSASFAKGGASKKRPSPHLYKVPTRSSKASPRTFEWPSMYTYITVNLNRVWACGMDLYCSALVRVQQWILLNTVMNL
jgi:hypothetical protein